MCIMVLPGVVIGGAVASFTRQAQRAARAFLLAELVWLLALALAEVLPAHSQPKGTWVNPVRNTRLMYDAVKAGRAYNDALKDTAPTMQRELETDSYECVAQWQDKKGKTVHWPMAEACMRVRGWILVLSAKEMADAYDHAWQAEVDRREKGEAGRVSGRVTRWQHPA